MGRGNKGVGDGGVQEKRVGKELSAKQYSGGNSEGRIVLMGKKAAVALSRIRGRDTPETFSDFPRVKFCRYDRHLFY